MTQVPPAGGNNVCYRHPDRQSFILCQRCGRTICPECQTQAAVGVVCPECMREQRATAPRTKPRFVTNIKAMTQRGRPTITYGIIALCVLVFVLEFVPALNLVGNLSYAWVYSDPSTGYPFQPWRLLTSVFLHSTSLSFGIIPFHLLLNMYTLWIFGLALEGLLGRARYLTLFLISGFAGSLAVMILMPNSFVLGASGAIFGLMGAFLVIQRHLGGNARQLLLLIVINFGIGFVIPGIAWQAHLGGFIGGAIVGLIYTRTRNRSQQRLQAGLIGGLAVALLAVSAVHLVL